jgi:hypothetical protein
VDKVERCYPSSDPLIIHLRSHPNNSPPTNAPSLRWRLLLVSGIRIRRDSRALAAERPIARFHSSAAALLAIY